MSGLLADVYAGVTRMAERLDRNRFDVPSGCPGWTVRELLFHLLLDAQRALVALAVPVPEPADTDAVTYWRAEGLREDDGQHAAFVRRAAAAYESVSSLLLQWTTTAHAAGAAAAQASGRVRTQGHVLEVADLVQTLVVEATLHHLDLVAHLPEAAGPSARSLAVLRPTLVALPGVDPGWADDRIPQVLTARAAPTAPERDQLGAALARLPVLS